MVLQQIGGEGVTLNLYISDVDSQENISLVVEDKQYKGISDDGIHYTFALKEIKRAKQKPYSADVFDGSDLIGSIIAHESRETQGGKEVRFLQIFVDDHLVKIIS